MSIGTTVHLQYCMNELVRVSFTEDTSDFCDHCGMNKKKCHKKCCKDEKRVFKTDDQKAQKFLDFNIEIGQAKPGQTFFSKYIARTDCAVERSVAFLANAPPTYRSNVPIYIQVRNLRI